VGPDVFDFLTPRGGARVGGGRGKKKKGAKGLESFQLPFHLALPLKFKKGGSVLGRAKKGVRGGGGKEKKKGERKRAVRGWSLTPGLPVLLLRHVQSSHARRKKRGKRKEKGTRADRQGSEISHLYSLSPHEKRHRPLGGKRGKGGGEGRSESKPVEQLHSTSYATLVKGKRAG